MNKVRLSPACFHTELFCIYRAADTFALTALLLKHVFGHSLSLINHCLRPLVGKAVYVSLSKVHCLHNYALKLGFVFSLETKSQTLELPEKLMLLAK